MVSAHDTERDRAVVTSMVPFGDADLVVRLLLRERGRIGVFAKGGRKSKRKYPGLGPLAVGEVAIRRRANASLDALEEADLRQDVGGLGQDPEAFGRACYLAEITERLLAEAEPHPEVFDLLLEALELLSAGRGDTRLLRAFELKLLGHGGYLPDLKAPSDGPCVGYDPDGGCLVASAGPGVVPFSPAAREAAVLLAGGELGALADIEAEPLREAGRIFALHLRRMNVGPLKSVEYLRALRGR